MAFDKRLLRQAKNAQTGLILTISFSLLTGIIIVGQAFTLSRIINRVFLESQTLVDIQPLLMGLFGLSLFRVGFSWAGQVTAQRTASKVKTDLRERLTAHLFALGPAYTQAEQSGELTNTAVEGIESLNAYFSQYLPQLATAALIPLTILLVVFPLDITSGLVLLLTAPLIPLFMILIGDTAEGLTRKQWGSLSRMSSHFLDTLQGLTTLKLFGRSRAQIEVIAQISDQFRQTTMDVLRVAFLSALVLELLATLSTAIIAVEIGLRLLYWHLTFEKALFILILAPEFYIPLRMLGTRFHAGMSGVAAAKRIFAVLDTKPSEIVSRAKPKPLPEQIRLRFENIHYAYAGGDRPALNGISFDLTPGKTVALVGASGAGKSTIASLLLGFIEPIQGQITLNETPLNQVDAGQWRSQIAWVPQNPYLFNASIAENIRLANPNTDSDAVIAAAKQAHLHSFIETLSEGYETIIGERGGRLSGGQAQRLALARAYLKDAPILILDEPTANLDPEIESQISRSMARLMASRTVLLIAHRLNTVRHADTILVLADGQIIQRGSHAELLAQDGAYRRLVSAYQGENGGAK